MDIVIVGKGNVGQALGPRFTQAGHTVRYAVRRPVAPDEISVAGAGRNVDAVVLAVPFTAVADAVAQLDLESGRGILIDATNPFGRPLPDGYTSGAQVVADTAPHGVPVVKAFNVMGAEALADPDFPAGPAVLPVAGSDTAAVDTVVALARETGFDAVDVGTLDAAGLMEEGARYWGLLAMAGGLGRDIALGVLHR